METFPLNPNTVAQKPVPQQGAPSSHSDSSGDFAPVMNETVTNLDNRNDQQDTPSNASTEQDTDTLFTDASELPESNDESASILMAATINNSAATLLSTQVPLAKEPQSNPLQPQVLNLSETVEDISTPLLTKESQSPVIPPATENELIPTAKAESLLLNQIQKILDQGKNNGSITITTSTTNSLVDDQNTITKLQNLSNPLLAESKNSEIQARQIGIAIPKTDDTSIATQKSTKLEVAHKDVTEQFFNAKLGESKTANSDNFQQNNSEQKGTEQQSKNLMQNIAAQTPGSSPSDLKPGVESGFSQQLNLNSVTTTQVTSIEGKMAPGAFLPVPENEMVSNLIQRFNVNPRLQTSRLSMQLHPAELGALKIDILVKDNSIKAHIVAQSPQVLDTLEKHMPRLREVLQDQGFKVDSFEISMEGDGGKQKELFQEHFNSQQQEFASNGQSSQKNESFDTLLDTENESNEIDVDTSGVNLTV
jgi:flagellar hook-length control protein FliK